jgi:adenylate cyclase
MAIEIERKFLLKNDAWRSHADEGKDYIQGYLVGSPAASVRVRIEGEQAYINIKSATLGITRLEYEYPIPLEDARHMLDNLCEKPLIKKKRYHVNQNGNVWEIDEFSGENAGLLVAEIELPDEDTRPVLPDWIGEEVSHDPRYYNVSLVKHPYSKW